MSGWTVLGLGLIVVGAAIGAPGLLLVGALTLFSRWLTTIWSRHGLDSIAFDRRLGSDRAIWGDEVPLDVAAWNQKLLPVPLLVTDDHVTETLRVRGKSLGASDRPGRGVLQNSWSLLWYERVVRHLVIDARRRGVFDFGPVRLTVSDLFERGSTSEERALDAALIVRPRSVPVRAAQRAHAPLGERPTRTSLFTDPARFAGVRPYRPGDSRRIIHWRATARARQPLSRRFEAVHQRSVLIAVDLQTVPGPHWLMQFDDEQVESLCVATASMARHALREGSACGVLLGTQLAGGRRWAYLAPSTSPGQLGRIEDVLARVEPIVSLPFEQLLRVVPRRVPPGTTLLVVGARDPQPYLDPLRRLDRSGYAVRYVALGEGRREFQLAARRAGVDAEVADLSPGWREADALVVAG